MMLKVALCIGLLGWPVSVESKWVHGSTTIVKGKATVLTKFCIDFNAHCRNHSCPDPPGALDLTIFAARRGDCPHPPCGGKDPELHLALLDDEYYSFPEVSQVWDELSCKEVLKASKRNFTVDWRRASTANGTHQGGTIVQKLRPRWWYIAVASCSDHDVSFSYSLHLQNPMSGKDAEFSFDAIGISRITLGLSVVFAAVTAFQLNSINGWRASTRTVQWGQVHPALLLVLAASSLATIGQACWLRYFWHYQHAGQGGDVWALAGRGGLVSARVLLSFVLLLLAQGECVCSPHITWAAHKEIVRGLGVFGVLSFMLELWGESELRSTVTEYVYDTRPGMVLVAFDILWMWIYATRAWRTFQAESRVKARRFFRHYATLFFLWFASLPAVAALARVLSPWVRYYVTCAVNGAVHVAALGLLVYTFQPRVAAELYELKATEYNKLAQEDTADMFDELEDDI